MFRSYWVITVALGLVILATESRSQTAAEDQPRQEESTSDTQSDSKQQNPKPVDLTPVLENIEAAIRDLIAEEDKIAAEAQQNRESRDLEAQEGMAKWAEWMFYATTATVVLTLAALMAIIRTLHHTRRAADSAEIVARDTKAIGEAQVRAYLHCGSASYEFGEDYLTATLQILNAGQSPATKVTLTGTAHVGLIGGLEHMPRVLDNLYAVETDSDVEPVSAQGETEGRITFFLDHHFADETELQIGQTAQEFFNTRNQVSFDLRLAWRDVFGQNHLIDLQLHADVNGPIEVSGDLSLYVDG